MCSGLLVVVVTPVVSYGHGANVAMVVGLGTAAGLAGLAIWWAPWGRWGRRATLAVIPVALGLMAAFNAFDGHDGYLAAVFFMVGFVWVGLAHPRGTALLLSPLLTMAYVVPLVGAAHRAVALSSALYVIPLCVILGETSAWLTQRLRRSEAALRHSASHDPLTGLANRAAFHEQLKRAVAGPDRAPGRGPDCGPGREPGRGASATPTAACVAVLYVDLDRFMEVNDVLGHRQGDLVLAAVALRLRHETPEAALVARLGGDEFGVLLCSSSATDASAVASRVAAALEEPFVIDDRELWVEASIGVAGCGASEAADATAILQHADIAMQRAKHLGVSVTTFEASMASGYSERIGLLHDLRRAIGADELVLHYQPKIEPQSGRAVGVEALVRWAHPEHGLLAPGVFLPLAEASGMIKSLTGWVFHAGLGQLARWRRQGLDLSLAVNVSGRELADDNLAERVEQWIREAGVPPDRVVVELTEHSAVQDLGLATTTLRRLRALGVRVSLDDFGSGYSSLAYLQGLPLDEVKLDRVFFAPRLDGSDTLIVRSVVDIGHHLGLTVVAEGVEQHDAVRRVAELGCDQVQGFVYTRPLPADELERWLDEHDAVTLGAPA